MKLECFVVDEVSKEMINDFFGERSNGVGGKREEVVQMRADPFGA